MRNATRKIVLALTVLTIVSVAATAEAGGRRRSHHFRHGHVHVFPSPIVYTPPVVVRRSTRVIVSRPTVYAATPSYSPANCHWVVCSGDTLYSIAEAQYGNGNLWSYVARYNGITDPAQFSAGVEVQLPVIYSDGSMRRSYSPVPVLARPQLAGNTAARL